MDSIFSNNGLRSSEAEAISVGKGVVGSHLALIEFMKKDDPLPGSESRSELHQTILRLEHRGGEEEDKGFRSLDITHHGLVVRPPRASWLHHTLTPFFSRSSANLPTVHVLLAMREKEVLGQPLAQRLVHPRARGGV